MDGNKSSKYSNLAYQWAEMIIKNGNRYREIRQKLGVHFLVFMQRLSYTHNRIG